MSNVGSYLGFITVEYFCSQCQGSGFVEMECTRFRGSSFVSVNEERKKALVELDHYRRHHHCKNRSIKNLQIGRRWHWTQGEYEQQVEQLRRTV